MRYTDHSFLSAHDQLLDLSQLDHALTKLAGELEQDYWQIKPLTICVMNGGLITSGQLLTRLNIDVDVDYCHATRYRNTTVGGQLQWKAYPQHELAGRHIILLDDIFDEGITLKLIAQYCLEQGAASVKTAVLLNKDHQRKAENFNVDYVGDMIEDRYVFGFGLDYQGRYRNAPGIFALKHDALGDEESL